MLCSSEHGSNDMSASPDSFDLQTYILQRTLRVRIQCSSTDSLLSICVSIGVVTVSRRPHF